MAKLDWKKVDGYDGLLDEMVPFPPSGLDRLKYKALTIKAATPHFGPFGDVEIWVPVSLFEKIEGLIGLIEKGLKEKEHYCFPGIGAAFLPLIPLTEGKGRMKLASLFSKFSTTSGIATLVAPMKLDELCQPTTIGEFAIKPFPADSKMKAARSATSPIFRSRRLRAYDGNLAIERAWRNICCFDVGPYEQPLVRWLKQVAWGERQGRRVSAKQTAKLMLGRMFWENYMSGMIDDLTRKFHVAFDELRAQFAPLVAGEFQLRDAFAMDGTSIIIELPDMSFMGSQGSMGGSYSIEPTKRLFGDRFSRFLAALTPLVEHVDVVSAATRDPHIRVFSVTILKSRQSAAENEPSVAFLLAFTALEYLLVGNSRNESIGRTLAKRLGALLATQQSGDFEDTCKEVQRLYDIRSRFVHDAQEIEHPNLQRLYDIVKDAYLVAIASSLQHVGSGTWVDDWRGMLDFVAAAFACGLGVDPALLVRAGLVAPLGEVSSVTGYQ